MSLPHSPGASANLASLAGGSKSRGSGSSLAQSLVAGKHPFADTARHRLDPVNIPPRASSLTESEVKDQAERMPQKDAQRDVLAQQPAQASEQERSSTFAAGGSTLEQQRSELVGRIATEARANKTELDEAGRQVFRAAGFEDRIGTRGTVDVDTRVLKPIIQETIIRKEHVEYQTVIDRHIHIHHVYPKIQPIHDPDPVRLQPRHRMFSPRTGHWHEVIGDEAAIELLGEDAFRNGPQTFREVRRAMLPGLDNTYEEQPEEIRGGRARVVERETIEGVTQGEWHRVGDGAIEDGRVIDGLEGLGEGVRTMHLTL